MKPIIVHRFPADVAAARAARFERVRQQALSRLGTVRKNPISIEQIARKLPIYNSN